MAQLTEQPADWAATAPVVVSNQRHIAAPVETVWARIADHESWPEWFTALSSVTVTFGAEGVGGGRDVKAQGMSVRERFTEWEPPHRFGFTLIEGPRIMAAMAETVVLTPDGSGCTISYTQGIEPARGFGWLIKLTAKRLDREQRKALDNLAALVEDGAPTHD